MVEEITNVAAEEAAEFNTNLFKTCTVVVAVEETLVVDEVVADGSRMDVM